MQLSDDEIHHILRGWHTLSIFLSETKSVNACNQLFNSELKGKKRTLLLKRLSSRIASLTAKKVKKELNEKFNGKVN